MTRKTEPLTILVMDDSADDVYALLFRLNAAGFAPTWQRAQTESEYCAALHTQLDVIFADTGLAQLSIERALDILQEKKLDIPIILLSRSTEEECGLESLASRATDVLLKNRLDLAGPAVRRALEFAHLKKEHKRVSAKLRELQRGSPREEVLSVDKTSTMPARKKTILLVDGDADSGRLTGLTLVRHGYSVLMANDAPSALSSWAHHVGQVDLLITNVALPGGLSGTDLATQLRSCQQNLKVIFVSDPNGKSGTKQKEAQPLLQRPFATPLLLNTIHEFLGN